MPTDNEIVKALDRLKKTKDFLRELYKKQVKKCPYPELKPLAKQTYEGNKNAFDIAIKAIEENTRQKAEIERLTLENLQMIASIKRLKTEAYKEFAERLKAYFNCGKDVRYLQTFIHYGIDRLIKELSEVSDK